MATVYSDFYNQNQTVEDGTAAASSIVLASTAAAQAITPGWIARPGLGGGRIKAIVARAIGATIGMTSGDVLRMFTLPSSARIIHLWLNSAGTSTTYAADFGVYLAGTNHDGAVVDVDLFGAGTALATTISHVDHFATGALEDEDRGRPLWHLCGIGGGSDTTDPGVNYDICFTSTATGTTLIDELCVICEYLSG